MSHSQANLSSVCKNGVTYDATTILDHAETTRLRASQPDTQMAMMVKEPSSSHSVDPIPPPSDTGDGQGDMAAAMVPMAVAEREAKKQRLRDLRDEYDVVKTIVVHMGNHYRSVSPPQWLDLRAADAIDAAELASCRLGAASGLFGIYSELDGCPQQLEGSRAGKKDAFHRPPVRNQGNRVHRWQTI